MFLCIPFSPVPPPTTLLHPSGDGSFSHLLGTTLVIEAVHNATPNLVTYDWTYDPGRSSSLQYDDNVNFGHLILENPQLINSGEFKLTLRLPGQAMDGSPLNSETPFSVVVQVECKLIHIYVCNLYWLKNLLCSCL